MSVIPENELPEYLSALLDGELSSDEQAQVEAWLAADPSARAELDELASVRSLLRGLPPVEPPSGFYERLLADPSMLTASLDHPAGPASSKTDLAMAEPAPVVSLAAARHHRSRRRSVVLGAVVAVAAAVALVIGLAPATEKLAPPVDTFLARHEKMAAMPAGESATLDADGFTPMAPDQMDSIPSEFVAPETMGSYQRVSAYRHTSGAMHVMYSDGTHAVSIYEQPGHMDWSELPSGLGTTTSVDGTPAWAMASGDESMMVVEKGPMVYTVVGTAPSGEMTQMVETLPPAPESFWQKLRRALHLD